MAKGKRSRSAEQRQAAASASATTGKAQHSGAEYRAKRAKGDVKLAGKPEPHAYLKLDASLVSKRGAKAKKNKAKKAYANVFSKKKGGKR